MKSLRRILIRELVVLHAIVVVIISLLAWAVLSRWAQQQAEARATAELHQLDRTLTNQFRSLEQVGDVVARWWSDGLVDPAREQTLWRQLVPLVESQGVLTGLNLVRADGQAFGLGRGAGGWAGRAIRLDQGSWVAGPIVGDPEGRFQQESTRPGPAMDFRTRPWYQAGTTQEEGRWSAPYRYIGRLEGQPGISYIRPVRTARGELLGVLSLDVLLHSLTRNLQDFRPTARSGLMLLDAEGRVLAPPVGPGSGEDTQRRELVLQPVDPARFPLAHRLFQAGPSGADVNVRQGWTHVYGRMQAFQGAKGLRWHLVLTLPADDLLSDPLRRALLVAGIGALLTTLLTWRVVGLSRRFADPLSALEAATTQLGQEADLALPDSDIPEIRRLSEALQTTHAAQRERDRLQEHLRQHQKLETVGTLAGGIAHDVNNQLTAVLGQISLGRERLANGQDPDRNLQRAEEATRRCAETTRALLSFSRPTVGERVSLNLNDVVREAAMLLKRGLGPSIHLEVDLSPNLPPILGDAVQLEQVLLNLGMNARDALAAGGFLRLGTAPDGPDAVLMWVEDNGVGMLPEVQARIFEPFYTTKPVGKGSGLGLSMVHGIAKAHGATLEVDSEWGRGTTIRLRLPVARGQAPRTEEPPAPPQGPWLAGRRILVVEDEPQIRQLLATALGQAGATVATGTDGEEGWEKWRQGPWDLVLSDHLMPRLTGLELLERLRLESPQTPVILASGRGLEGLEDRLSADSRLRLLPKPFHLNVLMLTLQELLEGTPST